MLITGMSGTGKSTVIQELAARGHRAIDADLDGLSEVVVTGRRADRPRGRQGLGVGRAPHPRGPRRRRCRPALLGGCSPNQGSLSDRFDHVVLLTAAPDVIAERLLTRTTNFFGKHPDELARTLALQHQIEPLLRAAADLEIITSAPLAAVVEKILDHVSRPLRR